MTYSHPIIHVIPIWSVSPFTQKSESKATSVTSILWIQLENIGRNWGGKNALAFHEIRSLSERLYGEQGNVNSQDLLGYKYPRTIQTYHDSCGDWVRVKVG